MDVLQDKYHKIFNKSCNTKEVNEAGDRAVNKKFMYSNVYCIFTLPNQNYRELEQASREPVVTGIDQVAAYLL